MKAGGGASKTAREVSDKPQTGSGTTRNSCFSGLDTAFDEALEEYFRLLEGHQPKGLHKLMITYLEKRLLSYILKRAAYNKSKACNILGISRATLRAKIGSYKIKIPKA